MFLSALVDFPDDAITGYDERSLDAMMRTLRDIGVKRVHMQWYSNRAFGYVWENSAPLYEGLKKTAEDLPEMGRSFANAAKRYGLETVLVMRPLETGDWHTFSPWYPYEGKPTGIPQIGGEIRIASHFLLNHSELRVKRRRWDTDPDVLNKTITCIRLYKQNDYPTNITKDDITLYVSDDNSGYRRYEGEFTFEISCEPCAETVIAGKTPSSTYEDEIIAIKDDPILVLTISGLNIKERYVAVAVTGREGNDPAGFFRNAPYHAIRCFHDGALLSATPGSYWWKWEDDGGEQETNKSPLDFGFNFDDGFGTIGTITLDLPGKTEYLAIAKGKNEYLPGTLCECEPAVQEYWMSLLDQALDEDFDIYANRIECHSAMTDEPYAYGYNDSIKAEYARRYGPCSEEEMEPSKIAAIRGDTFSELFAKGARAARARGKKVAVSLNLEMLHKPIPYQRLLAYPAHVDWQWERWLTEIQPDLIIVRTFIYSPEFVLNDPQCMAIINAAKARGVELTFERYVRKDFPNEYKRLRDTGLFSSMILYETATVMKSDGNGNVIITMPEMIEELKKVVTEGKQ